MSNKREENNLINNIYLLSDEILKLIINYLYILWKKDYLINYYYFIY